MEEKHHIINLCNDLKINYDDIFATANSVTIDNNRLKCKSIYLKRKDSQLYVICYAKQLESYFAWSLRVKKANKKTHFSVNIPTNIIPEQDGIIRIVKNLEFKGWGTETVYMFKKDCINNFLQIVLREAKNNNVQV